MRGRLIVMAMGLGLMTLTTAWAQEHKTTCSYGTVALPAELSGWMARTTILAAASDAGLARTMLVSGAAVDATLLPTNAVHYRVRPEKPGSSVSYGGLFAFNVSEAGTYRVALGSGAWIDVLRGEMPVLSTAHGHGPDCSGIRKMVDFALKPGRYVLQIAASGSPKIAMMVVRQP